jgi:hypothetical protein
MPTSPSGPIRFKHFHNNDQTTKSMTPKAEVSRRTLENINENENSEDEGNQKAKL